LNAQLGRPTEAAVCWLDAIWENESPATIWYRGWLQAEKQASGNLFHEHDLVSLLQTNHSPSIIRFLAAVVVWLFQGPPSNELRTYANVVRLLLEQHENWLPVRAVWLAQCSLSRLSGGDALALARTRERLLDRIAPKGLNLELDVPAFLRFAGSEAGERFSS